MNSRIQSISPPPSKRKRRASSTNDSSPATPTTELSIFSWNINGITPFLQKPITSFFKKSTPTSTPTSTQSNPTIPPASLCSFLRRHNWPTTLFLQEVKISPSDSPTQLAVSAAVRSLTPNEPDYAAFFSLPRDPHNARGFGRKIYGVCSIARRDWLESNNVTVRTVDWDLEGRVQVLETHPAPDSKAPRLSLWNIYAVNGTENAYRSPQTGEVAGTRHDRKLAFHALLLEECLRLQGEGYSVVLAGDVNIARGRLDGWPNLRERPEQHVRNRLDFNRKFFEAEGGFVGVDCFRAVNGDRRAYTYHPRGRAWGESCDRVDLIICSKGLRDCLSEADILESAAERGPSDHVPLFAKFTFEDTGKKSRKLDKDEEQ